MADAPGCSVPQEQEQLPQLLASSVDILGDGNFPQGCSFSPDGLCVLTCTVSDNRLRLYNTPPLKQPQHTPTTNEAGDNTNFDDCDNNESAGNKEGEGGDQANASSDNSTSSTPLSWKMALHAKAGDSVRSYAWYPLMHSSDPTTCAFLAASRDQPIHLYDAYTSAIRASYRPYNGLDEMESPNVVTFSPDGTRIFAAGFRTDRTIHIFRTDRPGRDSEVLRLGKSRRSSDGQKGMISALAFPQYRQQDGSYGGSSNPAVFAIGCYSPGSIYIYDDRMPCDDNPSGTILHGGICVVGHGKAFSRRKRRFAAVSSGGRFANDDSYQGDSHNNDEADIFSAAKVKWYQSRARAGITQLTWSPTGDYILYSASRRSDAVLAWDLRMLSGDASRPIRGLAAYSRDGDTNQSLEFCFDEYGKHMFVASVDKTVKIYNVATSRLRGVIRTGLADSVNGVSYKSTSAWGRKGGLLSVAVGTRRFDSFEGSDADEDEKSEEETEEAPAPGSLEVYKLSGVE